MKSLQATKRDTPTASVRFINMHSPDHAKRYTPELQLAVVSAVLNGETIRSTAKRYNVRKNIVQRWLGRFTYHRPCPACGRNNYGELLAACMAIIACDVPDTSRNWRLSEDVRNAIDAARVAVAKCPHDTIRRATARGATAIDNSGGAR